MRDKIKFGKFVFIGALRLIKCGGLVSFERPCLYEDKFASMQHFLFKSIHSLIIILIQIILSIPKFEVCVHGDKFSGFKLKSQLAVTELFNCPCLLYIIQILYIFSI